VPEMSDEELRALPSAVDLATAARALGIGRTKAYQLARAGEFPCPVLPLGARFRVTRTHLFQVLGVSPESAAQAGARPSDERKTNAAGTTPVVGASSSGVIRRRRGEALSPASDLRRPSDAAISESPGKLAAALTEVITAVTESILAAHQGRAGDPAATAPLLLTYQETCQKLGISTSALYRLLREGKIRSVALSQSVRRIPSAELDRYVAALMRDT
jgi:excisionase family DNA binding protein